MAHSRPYGTNNYRYNNRYEGRKKKSSSSNSSDSEQYSNPVHKPEPREEHKILKNHFKHRTGIYCINPTLSYTPHENVKSSLATQLGHIDITYHGEAKDSPKSYYIYTVPSFGTQHNSGVPNNGKSSIKIYCLNHQGKGSDSTTQGKEIDFLNFRAVATSLAINPTTSSTEVLDLAIGFQSGEILLHDPLEKIKTDSKQFNRGSQLASGSVTKIRWVPGERHTFAVSFSSGTMLFMDRTLTAIHPISPPTPPPSPSKNQKVAPFSCLKQTKPGSNPVKAWNISKGAIKDFCFSPDGYYLVAACQDGYLRFFHYGKDSLLVLAKSYYGGFQCVDWSSDGRIVIAGGEDDLVTLWEWDWSSCKCKCRARGESHRSWVAALAFDHNFNGYRFGSVGEDGRLNLWEYIDNEEEPGTGGRIVPKPRGDSLWGRPTLAKLGSGSCLTTISVPTYVPSPTTDSTSVPSTDGINNKTNGHSVADDHHRDTANDTAATTTLGSNGAATVGTNGTNNNTTNPTTPRGTPIKKNGSTNIPKNPISPQKGISKNGLSGGGGVPENTELPPSVMVMSVPPAQDVPDMVPLVSHTAHHGPCSGIAFLSSKDILTSAWGGDVKFWQFCME